MGKLPKYALSLFITLLIVGSFLLLRWFLASNGRYTGNRPRIEIVNKSPDINVEANAPDIYQLMDEVGFLSEKGFVFDDFTSMEYEPAKIILTFEEMTEENPGYIQVFNAKKQRVYGYTRDVNADSYSLTYYLNKEYFQNLNSKDTDLDIEGLLKKSFIYLGKVHQKKARLTRFERQEVFKVLLIMSGKYDLVDIEKN